MPVAHLNGTKLFHMEVGQGPPCLMMHGGLGFDHTMLHPWLDPLGEQMRLVYYDHRGNGHSGRTPSETLTFEQFCSDADALRDHLGFERVGVMGHSYGGFIALEYALRYPERLSHLILFHTAPATDHGEEIMANLNRKGATQEQMEAIAASPESDAECWRLWKLIEPLYFHNYDAELAERLFGKTVMSAEASKAGDAILGGWNLTSRLGEISAPTLILVGQDDFICPPSRAKVMHERIPNSELAILENSGHMAYVEEAEAFFATIRDWLQRA